jgi:hypothetical protein
MLTERQIDSDFNPLKPSTSIISCEIIEYTQNNQEFSTVGCNQLFSYDFNEIILTLKIDKPP